MNRQIHAQIIISLMDNSRVQYCRVVANVMPAIQSIATMYDEWPVPMRSHSKMHLLPTTRDFPIVAANVIPNHVQCMSIRKIDIQSVKQINVLRKIFTDNRRIRCIYLPQTMIEPVVLHNLRSIWIKV